MSEDNSVGGRGRSHRLQIIMPSKSMERVDRLVEMTEASSIAEVIRNALRVYEAVIDGAESGRPFFQEVEGKMVPVVMMNA